MKLENLKPAKGSIKNSKKIGRGEGSGKGGTATRGTKGAKSRSGYKHKIGFEGGQMPLQRIVPKFGFRNPNRVEFKAVNVGDLQAVADLTGKTVIDVQMLKEAGLVKKNENVKILGDGELKAKLEVSANGFSKTAIEKIEAVGGKATKI